MIQFEKAYREAGPKIVGWLVATGTDEATARDILHDAVARVEAAAARGDAGAADCAGLSAILFTAARNLRANHVRDSRRMVPSGRAGDVAGGVSAPPAGFAADAAYLRGRMAAALAELPPALRETYALYQIGGRSVRETAALTGAAENLVKVRLHRAKARLRVALADIAGAFAPGRTSE